MSEHDKSIERRTSPWNAISVVLLGQAVGGLGILIQFVGAPGLFAEIFGIPFPPGLVYIAGAASLVWLDRRSEWSPMGAIALSMWIIGGGLLSGDLIDNLNSGDSLVVTGNVVMVAGLALSVLAGAVAVARSPRDPSSRRPSPLSSHNPRRGAILATIATLVVAGASLAAAERMEFQGGGPYPFVALAIGVALIRGQYMVGLAIVFAIVYFGSALGSPQSMSRLSAPSEVLVFVATVVHLLSLIGVVAAGLLANNRPANPARVETDTPSR